MTDVTIRDASVAVVQLVHASLRFERLIENYLYRRIFIVSLKRCYYAVTDQTIANAYKQTFLIS